MKRAVLYILALLTSVIGAAAQSVGSSAQEDDASAQEAIYIYRNDGGFDAFLREDVDRITFSRIGADSLFGLCGSATGLGFSYKVGLKECIDFKFDALEYAQNGGAYAALCDSYARITVPKSVNAYAQLGLFGPAVRWDMPPYEVEPQWGSDKYLLPLFSETTATVNKENRSVALRADVTRDLLFPVELGYSVYNSKEELVNRKYLNGKYQRQAEWVLNGVEASVTDLKAAETYTAYPTVRIMGQDLTALPSKEFKLDGETCSDDNHPHLIDLGLPSGTKWACCNIGASSPSDYGNYYAWGETSTKSDYTDSNSQTYGKTMGDIGGNLSYDAARANWGGSWRLPTESEFEELLDKCTWTWTSQGGHNGYQVKGPNGRSIFLPAAGWRDGSSLYDAGEGGYYWSSTPYESDSNGA